MREMRIREVDKVCAARIVNARRQANDQAFRAAFDSAIQRYGGIERLVWVLGDELAKVS